MSVENNIFELIRSRIQGRSEEVVFECGETRFDGPSLIAATLNRQRQFAGLVSRGDSVLLFDQRGAEFWIDVMAVWRSGCVAVPVPCKVGTEHLTTIIEKTGASAFCGQASQHEEQLAELNSIDSDVNDCLEGEANTVAVSGGETASVIFTSGSTGRPKGAALSHDGLGGNCVGTAGQLKLKPGDRLFVPIPFNFVSCLSHFLVSLYSGACFIAEERLLMQGDFLKMLQEKNANCFGGAPLQLRWIRDAIKSDGLKIDWVMASGDHLSPDILKDIRLHSPHTRINVVYGLTELSGRCCILAGDELNGNETTVGRPIDGFRIQATDEVGRPLPPGEIGEIWVAGDHKMKEYVNDPDETAQSMDGEWFKTGDMGFMDEESLVTICGRKDDVFKQSGVKISTLLINDALMAISIFTDAVAVPEEHPILGHIPIAYYILKPNQVFHKGTVLRKLRELLPANHIPMKFTELERIPRTGSGKLARKEFTAYLESRCDKQLRS